MQSPVKIPAILVAVNPALHNQKTVCNMNMIQEEDR